MTRTEALHFINVAHFMDHFFLLIFPTAAIAIAPTWGMNFADVLLFGSPLYIMFALGTLPSGWLGDRYDRLMLITVFFIGCGASSLWIALASGPVALMIGLGALGAFASIYHPVGLAHVTQIGLRSGRALAINGVFGNMGLAAATITTGVLAQTMGWQSAFAVPGALSIAIGAALFLRSRDARALSAPMQTRDVKPSPSYDQRTQWVVFAVICIAALFGGMVFNMVTISLPKFLEERLISGNADLLWIGASAGVIFAIAAFAQLPVGELLDRMGARPILLSLMMGEAVLFLILTQAAGWLAFGATLAAVTLVFAGIPITTWLVGHYLNAGIRSRAVSVEYVLSLGVGSAAVPLIAMLQRLGLGFEVQFAGLAMASVAIFTAAWFLPKTSTKQEVTI
ncbi:Major Facilitator Superfamily protein [Roseovarius albus]|uniref:Major Facilitator Superfamily protein n=1 Tax=Roseovarius albus TaxID=1247867 RepID=A0A1X6YM40_9RHOB|nr:MFS transporter [Roseovarius albus]SLN24970.1 Major Facilitator Superfamily protein [Roseovarius albus]